MEFSLSDLLPLLGQTQGMGPNQSRENQPSEAHKAFIPTTLNDNVVTLSASTLNRDNMKTVFIGIKSSSYTQAMWEEDYRRWMDEFQLLQQNCEKVQIQELEDMPMAVDYARALGEINRALITLNNVPCGQTIRVICLGPGVSQLTLDALTYLVREWKTPDNVPRASSDKKLQVVTTGEQKTFNLFNLCKKLCISGACHSIEFFNTMDYFPFGHYRNSYFFKN